MEIILDDKGQEVRPRRRPTFEPDPNGVEETEEVRGGSDPWLMARGFERGPTPRGYARRRR